MYGRSLSLILSAAGAALLSASATAQNVGLEGPSYVGAGSFPTASKPQSKLWFHDGAWWASMFDTTDRVVSIHRLDPATEEWVDTNTTIDTRNTSHADCLVVGNGVYVVSHHFVNGGAQGFPLNLSRFDYDASNDRYTLAAGFPVQLDDVGVEAAVLERDSTGRLWAVWTFGSRVWITHTVATDAQWVDPFVLPSNTTDLQPGDIASIVRFGGNKVGVMWSDQTSDDDGYFFSVHQDGASPSSWSSPEEALVGPDQADDHVHLKASSDGRVFAAVKNALDEVWLRVRATNGTWSGVLLANAQDGWTRPILALDQENAELHAFATQPILGGTIFTKKAPLATLAFPAGRGTAYLRNEADPTLNDATSTKQSLTSETGLVVVASHQGSRHYWYRVDELAGGGGPGVPVAEFQGAPRSGIAPLSVQFTDTSSGQPDSWLWNFGDGTTSTLQNPSHVYAGRGRFDVTLRVTNALGTDQERKAGFVVVLPDNVAQPLHDTYVHRRGGQEDREDEETLKVRRRGERSDHEALLRFDLSSIDPDALDSATLRLYCKDGRREEAQVQVFLVSNDWNPATVTWDTRPQPQSGPIGTSEEFRKKGWIEIDLGSALASGGVVTLSIVAADEDAKVQFHSSETTRSPELVFED